MFSDILQHDIISDEKLLAKATEIAETTARLREDINKHDIRIAELKKLIRECKLTYDIVNKIKTQFRDDRLREIEEQAEALLDLVFSEENFGVHIESDRVRNKNLATLKLGPKNVDMNVWQPPVAQNGGFVEQLVGTSVIAALSAMNNVPFLMFDEQFCSGDPKSCSQLKPFIEYLTSKFQVLIIEHKPELYTSVDRREIHLAKDRGIKGEVHLMSCNDLKGTLEE